MPGDGSSRAGDGAERRDDAAEAPEACPPPTRIGRAESSRTGAAGSEVPAWPPLVHVPGGDREALLRRIVGG